MNTLMLDAVLIEVAGERVRQEQIWGEQNHGASRYYLILAEEVGEVAKAILEHKVKEYRAELVQVAAVAVAMIECLDRNNFPCDSPENRKPTGETQSPL